jgi:hypothetical protein
MYAINASSPAMPGGGATITPAAPAAITSLASAARALTSRFETPTTIGTRCATRVSARRTTARDSSGVSFGASPMMPSSVTPWTRRAR